MSREILEDLSPQAISNAIEENALEGIEAWSRWPEMELHRDPGVTWTMTDLPFPLFNNVTRTQLTPYSVASAIAAVQSQGRERNVPVAWWTGASFQPANLGEYLEAAGFSHAFGAPAMAVEIENMNESLPAPANLVTEEVTDEDTLRTWNEVYTEVFEYPDFTREPWFRMLASLGLGPEQQWRHFLARLEGKPVATASLFLWAGVAGIADVTTLPEARRQGVGTEITLALLREARRLGYRVGTLFASEMGLPVYRQIGFRPYFRGNCYIWTPEEGDTEPLRSSLAPFGQGS